MSATGATWTRRRVPPATRDSIARAVRAGLEGLRALPPMRLGDWAAKHFVLTGESSHQRGGWEAWPFQVAILDWMGDDDIEELDVLKSKRVGYTKMLAACIAFDAAYRRRNQAVWQPTDDDRDSFVKSEIDPMIERVAAVAAARRLTRAGEDTLKLKQFRGCVAHFLGGKAARAYRRITVASVKLDELSAFDQKIEGSGDPFTLAHGRLEGAPFPKAICGSTPRIKDIDHTERRAAQADVFMRYHVTCIHCGIEHPLSFGDDKSKWGFKWARGDEASVRHVCPHCRGSITQAQYLANWQGTWVCDITGSRYGVDREWRSADGRKIVTPRHVAAQVWTAYSPQRKWSEIVKQWRAANDAHEAGDDGPKQAFINEVEGRTYEPTAEGSDENELQARAKQSLYRLGQVPVGCLVLVAAVDVQDNRFEVTVWGFGRGEQSWVIDDQVLEANPADERDWAKLDAYLCSRFPQMWQSGGTLGIEAVGVDTGGHFTHQVYNFVRAREHRRFCALKGSSKTGGPIKGGANRVDVNWRGQVVKGGVKLWEVGTDTAKDLLHGRLRVSQPGPGYVNFASDLTREWFEQLTAEVRVLQKTAAGEVYRWVKRRLRNEKLDCAGYALFLSHFLDLHRYTERMWDKLEAAVQPPPDLFAPAVQATDPALEVTPSRHDAMHARAQQVSPSAAPVSGSSFQRAW